MQRFCPWEMGLIEIGLYGNPGDLLLRIRHDLKIPWGGGGSCPSAPSAVYSPDLI